MLSELFVILFVYFLFLFVFVFGLVVNGGWNIDSKVRKSVVEKKVELMFRI